MWSLDQEYQHPWGLVRNAYSQVEPQTPESRALGGARVDPSACAAALQGVCFGARLGDAWFQSLLHTPSWHVLLVLRVLL